jgi:hypothetical protein
MMHYLLYRAFSRFKISRDRAIRVQDHRQLHMPVIDDITCVLTPSNEVHLTERAILTVLVAFWHGIIQMVFGSMSLPRRCQLGSVIARFPGSATFHDTSFATMYSFAGGISDTKDIFSIFQK